MKPNGYVTNKKELRSILEVVALNVLFLSVMFRTTIDLIDFVISNDF